MRYDCGRAILGCIVLLAATSVIHAHQSLDRNLPGAIACRVTQPNGVVAGSTERDSGSFGNQQLSTFGLWPGGVVLFKPGGPGFITSDGALGMKYGWQRGVRGPLTVEGRRVDAAAPRLRAEVNSGYGDVGFQASYVIFPTPGCWEVTAHVGNASLTFVTSVIKIGDGPEWRRGL